MRTSARPRTLVLGVSDVVIDVAMLGPQGQELGPKQIVPITTETATLWNAIEQLGEFDRITQIGTDRNGLCERIARQSQRPLRRMSHGELVWTNVIAGRGVELALTFEPRFRSTLYHGGIEVPNIDVGKQLVRKDRRIAEYLTLRVLDKKGEDAWLRRVSRVVDELLAVWNPATLYLAVPPTHPMPELQAQVVVVRGRSTLDLALSVWDGDLQIPAATHA